MIPPIAVCRPYNVCLAGDDTSVRSPAAPGDIKPVPDPVKIRVTLRHVFCRDISRIDKNAEQLDAGLIQRCPEFIQIRLIRTRKVKMADLQCVDAMRSHT
jgi:hypothetical protein